MPMSQLISQEQINFVPLIMGQVTSNEVYFQQPSRGFDSKIDQRKREQAHDHVDGSS